MPDVICPNGHQQVRTTARFCYVCRAPIGPQPDPANGVCANGHAQARSGAKFCYLCRAPIGLRPDPANGICVNGHAQLKPTAKFCFQCGQPVIPQASGPIYNGRYQVVREIGRGGMASTIYRVVDIQDGRRALALKEIDKTQLDPKDADKIIEAFEREEQLLQRLNHPNIIRSHDFFQEGGKYFMAMDLVEGRTLEKILESSPGGFPETRVLPWAEQLCDALGYLHAQTPPIIYRDLKPANVMIEDAGGQVKIIDFGIAREFKGGKKKGDTIRFGTAGYAPPEQYEQSKIETRPASDVYALGALLYHLLSGDDPTNMPLGFFSRARLTGPAVGASQRVADALEKAVAMDADQRFQSMAEFGKALTGHAAPVSKKSPRPAKAAGPQASGATPPLGGSAVPAQPVPLSVGALRLSESKIDFGVVEKGDPTPHQQTFMITGAAGQVAVQTSDAWLNVIPDSAKSGEVVAVLLKSEALMLATQTWAAPNLIERVTDRLRRLPQNVWWLILLALLFGASIRPIWQGAVLLVGGWLGAQLVAVTAARLVARLIALPTGLKGKVVLKDRSGQKTLPVEVKAVPSQWRMGVSWVTLIGLVGVEVLAISAGLVYVAQLLGR